ncbi:MAG: RusA family crossover junction endodeoxyribonuclease [Synergistaceae bacterium]|nr:RusA family crossover junction endodeoxyribonuclease [Synergistaceae bacterium]
MKALQDCLSMAGVIQDDSQLDKLHIERNYGKGKGTRIIVQEQTVNYQEDIITIRKRRIYSLKRVKR